MRIVVAGSSGFLGRHLTARLRSHGHRVVRLVRHTPRSSDERRWDPDSGELDNEVLTNAEAIVNLCGAGVANRRWTPRYKQLIRDSRVKPTHLLAKAAAATGTPTLLNASAVGWYGDTGDRTVDESAPAASDFLGVTCQEWEISTAPAAAAGVRVATLRTGHVLSRDSVMVTKLTPVFRFGLGGRFGSGRQYFPWVSLKDWLDASDFVLANDIHGPVNMVGPQPATNRHFTRALGRQLRRPAVWPIPGFTLRVVAGEAASDLLRGTRAVPKVLNDNGYKFAHSTVDDALAWTFTT